MAVLGSVGSAISLLSLKIFLTTLTGSLGVLSEAHATRRYAEELEMARRDLTGGD